MLSARATVLLWIKHPEVSEFGIPLKYNTESCPSGEIAELTSYEGKAVLGIVHANWRQGFCMIFIQACSDQRMSRFGSTQQDQEDVNGVAMGTEQQNQFVSLLKWLTFKNGAWFHESKCLF